MREKIQEEAAYSILKNKFNGLINISPRVGKTKIIIDGLRKVPDTIKRILVTIPYNSIEETWMEEFQKWGLDSEIRNKIHIINQRSLEKETISPDILISDEIHSLSERQIEAIKELNPSHILGMSGTISRETKNELRNSLNLKEIYRFSIEDAIKYNIISNYDIKIIPINLNTTDKYVEAGSKKKKFYTTEARQYDYLTKMFRKFRAMSWEDPQYEGVKYMFINKRKDLIYKAKTKIELAKKLINNIKERKLIFTTFTDIADELAKYSHHSKNEDQDNLTKFIEGQINELSVCNMVSMGRHTCPY